MNIFPQLRHFHIQRNTPQSLIYPPRCAKKTDINLHFAKNRIHLQAHTAVVIGALPESRLVVGAVHAPIGIVAPEPLTAIIIHYISLYVVPRLCSHHRCVLYAMETIEVNLPYYSLCLNPPVLVVAIMPVAIALIHH